MSKIARNDPCFCGSGKKFKKCCDSKKNQLFTLSQSKVGAALESTSERNVSRLGGLFFAGDKTFMEKECSTSKQFTYSVKQEL